MNMKKTHFHINILYKDMMGDNVGLMCLLFSVLNTSVTEQRQEIINVVL